MTRITQSSDASNWNIARIVSNAGRGATALLLLSSRSAQAATGRALLDCSPAAAAPNASIMPPMPAMTHPAPRHVTGRNAAADNAAADNAAADNAAADNAAADNAAADNAAANPLPPRQQRGPVLRLSGGSAALCPGYGRGYFSRLPQRRTHRCSLLRRLCIGAVGASFVSGHNE